MGNRENEIKLKKCCSCKENKTLDLFNKDKSRKDGLHNYCKLCKSIQDKKWIENNPERNKLSRSKSYLKNKENILVKVKGYNINNKENKIIK